VAPRTQSGEVFHSEAGVCPAVMVLAREASGHLRLVYSSMIQVGYNISVTNGPAYILLVLQGRRRYRHGQGPVLIPTHCVVIGEVCI
jgi:hypothetical protein